jgi:hypothetical protein
MRYADLSGANLAAAWLSEADLSYANLTGANLTGVNMQFGDMTYANLTDANMTDADLHRVLMQGATNPDGKKIPLTIGSTIDLPEYLTALTDKELSALQDEIVAALTELAIKTEFETEDAEWYQEGRLEEALAKIVTEQNRRDRKPKS